MFLYRKPHAAIWFLLTGNVKRNGVVNELGKLGRESRPKTKSQVTFLLRPRTNTFPSFSQQEQKRPQLRFTLFTFSFLPPSLMLRPLLQEQQ